MTSGRELVHILEHFLAARGLWIGFVSNRCSLYLSIKSIQWQAATICRRKLNL
jgi:hypothetical protein